MPIVFSATDQPAYGFCCDGDEVELFSVPKDQQTHASEDTTSTSSLLGVSEGPASAAPQECSADRNLGLCPSDECDDNDTSLRRIHDDSVEIYVENIVDVLSADIEQALGCIEVDYHNGPLITGMGSIAASYTADTPMIPVGVIDNAAEEEKDDKGILSMDYFPRRVAFTDLEEDTDSDVWSKNKDRDTCTGVGKNGSKARRRSRRRLCLLLMTLLMVLGAIVALSIGLLANRATEGGITNSVVTDEFPASVPETTVFDGPTNEDTISDARPEVVQTDAPASDEGNTVPPSQPTPIADVEQPIDNEESASDESIAVTPSQPTSPFDAEQPIDDEESLPQTKEDIFIYSNPPSSNIPDHVAHVIHIVVDGLRPDYMNGPNFDRLKSKGACTLNARHDWASSQTLPNHIGMFTGLTVAEHGYFEDADNGGKLINPATGEGFENIFDLVKDAGGTTAFYGSKEKFALFDRSWSIDTFVFQKRGMVLVPMFLEDMNKQTYNYAFLHVRNPDRAGHKDSGGATAPGYSAEVAEADSYLGQVFHLIENNPELLDNAAIVLTADHGFADTGNHADKDLLENNRIPFCTYGPGVVPGADLIDLNSPENGGVVVDPGTSRGQEGGQIIRNSYSGVLAADWLGFRPNTGAFSNQFLRYQ